MKNSLKNVKLWQKKRNELPVSDDKQSDWLDMNAILDQHMPIATPTGKVSWLRSKKLKTFALTFVSFSAAAMVYVVSNVYHVKNSNHKNITHNGIKRHRQLNSDNFAEKDNTTTVDSSLVRDTANLLTVTGIKNNKIDSLAPNAVTLNAVTLNNRTNTAVSSISKKPGESSSPAANVDNKHSNAKNSEEKINSVNGVNNSPNDGGLAKAGAKSANSSSNKISGNPLFSTNSKDKNGVVSNSQDNAAAHNAANDSKIAEKNAADKKAHTNNSAINSTGKATAVNKAGNDNDEANNNTKATNNATGNSRISNNKSSRNNTTSNLSIARKGRKNTLVAKTGSGNKSKLATNNIGGSKVTANSAGSTFVNHGRGQGNSNNLAISNGPSAGKLKSHHGHRNKKGDEEEFDDEPNDKLANVALTEVPPKVTFEAANTSIKDVALPLMNRSANKKQLAGTSKANKKQTEKTKEAKVKRASNGSSIFSGMDWGLLVGVNSSGSFTSKNQNANFYGSSPVDFFLGVSAAYNFNNKWALNTQIKVFNPQSISNNYTHATDGAIDSPKTLQITSARKIYSLEVPLQLSYRINNYVSVMAGPLISFPVKQAGISNNLLTRGLKKDSAYFVRVADTISRINYQQKVNFGLSAGLNFQYKHVSFGAMWNQNLSGYQISSDFGTYKSKPGTLQFSVGWQLDKIKQK